MSKKSCVHIMAASAKCIATSVLLFHLVGCSTQPQRIQPSQARPQPLRPAASIPPKITVLDFVKTPGTFAYRAETTVADALAAAGGYGECESCEDHFREHGKHPTYDWPPRVLRQGMIIQLPGRKTEWMQFRLQPHDEVRFRHVVF
jgi:hypothetical protein